jgi:hydrogenase maturation protease
MSKVVSLPRPPLLVIACGNLTCGDDRAGLEFLRKLRPQSCARYAAREMPQLSVDLLELFQQAESILFVDAVETGAAPGTLHLVPLPYAGLQTRSLNKLSGHGWGLKEVLELARSLGREVPRLAGYRAGVGRAWRADFAPGEAGGDARAVALSPRLRAAIRPGRRTDPAAELCSRR